MKLIIAFWSILLKDVRTYYLKPPVISGGLLLPLAWTGLFLIKSGGGTENVLTLLPGVIAVSVLFGTTSMLAVSVTFEKRQRSMERLLLAPIPLTLLLSAKTFGAIVFGTVNALVPIILSAFLADLAHVSWAMAAPAIFLIATASAFLGMCIAVSVREVFEAQTLSNFFRFPMIFLCGLFFPIQQLPVYLQPLPFFLPLTYGADILHASVGNANILPVAADFVVLFLFCVALFWFALRNMKRRWIA